MLKITTKLITHDNRASCLMRETALKVIFVQWTTLDVVDSLLILFKIEQGRHFFTRHGVSHDYNLSLVSSVIGVKALLSKMF